MPRLDGSTVVALDAVNARTVQLIRNRPLPKPADYGSAPHAYLAGCVADYATFFQHRLTHTQRFGRTLRDYGSSRLLR